MTIFLVQKKIIKYTDLTVKYNRNCLQQDSVTFTHGNVDNLYIVYKLDPWWKDLNTCFTLVIYLLETVKLT